jgi:hypothetical protein
MEPQNQNGTVNTSPISSGGDKSIGPAIGIIIIITVMVLGGLYFWGQRAEKQTPVSQESANPALVDQTTIDLQKQSSSDNLNSIEADLNNTKLNQLGVEVNSAEAAAAASVTGQ